MSDSTPPGFSRRSFLRTTSAAAVGLSAGLVGAETLGRPALAPVAPADREHPFLLCRRAQFPELRERAAREPWTTMAKNAVQAATEGRDAVDGGRSAIQLRKYLGACALAYIVDPDNQARYAGAVYEGIVGDLAETTFDETQAWSGVVPPMAAAFVGIIALDVVYEDLEAAQVQECEYVIDTQIGKISEEGSWLNGRRGTHGTWEVYRGERTEADDVFYDRSLEQMTDDGVATTASSYAWSRLGSSDSRPQKTGYADVLEFTGIDTRYYDHPRLQRFYRWLFGAAVTPSKHLHAFGDFYIFNRYPFDAGQTEQPENAALAYRAGRFDPRAGRYMAWALEGEDPPGHILAYAVGHSGDALPGNAWFERSLLLVHGQEGARAYFVTVDEVQAAPGDSIQHALHLATGTAPEAVEAGLEYEATIDRFTEGDGNRLSIVYGRVPDEVVHAPMPTGSERADASAHVRQEAHFRANHEGEARLVTVLFPHATEHEDVRFTHRGGRDRPGRLPTGVSIAHESGAVDHVYESAGYREREGAENARFRGRVVLYRAQDRPSSPPRPNVLVIVSDDQGWNDIGYHNRRIRTPHLDRLAADGVTLDQYYVHPQCTPTRLALMTGRYASRFPPRTWTWTNEQAIPKDILTIAEMFSAEGYATGMSGKWHLGSKPKWGPSHYGFDYSYGSLAGGVGIYDHRYRLTRTEYADTWHRNGTLIEEMGHRTTLTADKAVQWIEQHRGEPWFFYVPFHAPHTPLAETDPTWWQRTRHIEEGSRQLYAASLVHMDAAVGRMIDALERTDQRRETLIVFFSDNGAALGDYDGGGYPPPDPNLSDGYSSNDPLRSGKTHVYEGGIRVPAFVHWKGTLSPRTVKAPMHVVDWMPTVADLIGGKPPEASAWDGRDVWPLLTGARTSYEEARTLYWVWGGGRAREAVRRGAWKLVREDGRPWELYHLSNDPREQTDLSDDRPRKIEALLDVYQRERRLDWEE